MLHEPDFSEVTRRGEAQIYFSSHVLGTRPALIYGESLTSGFVQQFF